MEMKCPNCGSTEFETRSDGGVYCKFCGNMVQQGNAMQSTFNKVSNNISAGKKDKMIAALLAIFLGGVGAQYFYFGNYLVGIICLLFCWTGIPGIWGLIHGILMLTMSDQDFQAKYSGHN
jgi:TM2 domain-containing membrane protein YozV